MFQKVSVKFFGRHRYYNWDQHGQVNLIIGENDTGKTQLLKLLYSISKSLESFEKKRLSTTESWSYLLAKKLLWTFQPDNFELGKLVTRGKQHRTNIRCCLYNEDLNFSFGQATTKRIRECSVLENTIGNISTLYIPPKEVFSMIEALYATRKQLEIPGVDDTYIDLIEALRLSTTRGKISTPLRKALRGIKNISSGGRIKLEKGEFKFIRGREKYTMSSVAEGLCKIGVYRRLILNRTLSTGTILFIDEPESNLHPKAIILLAEMLYQIANSGIQIYIATHSEFLLKRFEQLVRENSNTDFARILSLTVDSKRKLNYTNTDLQEGLPDNPILEQSLSLYETDVKLDLQ